MSSSHLSHMRRHAVHAAVNHLSKERSVPATRPQSMPAQGHVFIETRDPDMPPDDDGNDDKMINILLIVLGIVFLSLVLTSVFFLLRRRRLRRMQAETLPCYHDAQKGTTTRNVNGLTIETSHTPGQPSVIVIGRDGNPMLANPNSPPHSPDNVPEIHITFPDEQDEQGRRKSGRVLVVRVGDNATIGLEPMQDEQLPAYEKDAKAQFHSIDMDQIGGLKEKDSNMFQ